MNSASITGQRSVVAEHLELVKPQEVPAVAETSPPAGGESPLPNETEAGLLRFAKFLRASKSSQKQKDRDKAKLQRGFQAYAEVKDFDDRLEPGQIIDRWR